MQVVVIFVWVMFKLQKQINYFFVDRIFIGGLYCFIREEMVIKYKYLMIGRVRGVSKGD